MFKKKKSQEEINEENFKKWLEEYRECIPPDYNKIQLMDDFTNPDYDWFISISNRSDGKSFNYIGFLIYFALKSGVPFLMVCRHWTIQNAYVELIYQICDEVSCFDPSLLVIKTSDDYKLVIYDKVTVCMITDFNNASDLKYSSSLLKKFTIAVYDEFLTLKNDYLPDEWERFKTIMDGVDRNHKDLPYIHTPRALLMGNAVNFDSPFIAHLKLFNKLETQPINSKRYYNKGKFKVIMEINRNDNVKEKRNSRMFGAEDDPMETAQFKINSTFIIDDDDLQAVKARAKFLYIKTRENMLKVLYNREKGYIVLSVEVDSGQDYDFCTETSDIKKGVRFMNEFFYDDEHHKKYTKGLFLFENSYSKNTIVDDPQYSSIKIHKCIKIHDLEHRDPMPFREIVYQENTVADIKRNLFRKFMQG